MRSEEAEAFLIIWNIGMTAIQHIQTCERYNTALVSRMDVHLIEVEMEMLGEVIVSDIAKLHKLEFVP